MQRYIVEVYEDRTEWKNDQSQLHRLDGPAIEWSNGDKSWYVNGHLHRDDGPAVEYSNGYKAWFVNGQRHRDDGPAIEWSNGDKSWYVNGQLHRLDGPAVEYSNGTKLWYKNGEILTEKEFIQRTQIKELSVSDIEKLLGYPVKITK